MQMDSNNESGLVGGTVNWFQHPFNSQGSALNWVLFLGLLFIAAWFWNHVLMQIQDVI